MTEEGKINKFDGYARGLSVSEKAVVWKNQKICLMRTGICWINTKKLRFGLLKALSNMYGKSSAFRIQQLVNTRMKGWVLLTSCVRKAEKRLLSQSQARYLKPKS
ncbi:hypothetical protein HanIR_Chr10g0502411 [Helianthus annuus]|nr:hypothetical protein HanIR_Chr10g0502411 [Helianthus annuus]